MTNVIRIEFAPALMTREIAAYYLSMSVREVDQLRFTNQITPVGDGRRVKFRKTELDDYIRMLNERPSSRS